MTKTNDVKMNYVFVCRKFRPQFANLPASVNVFAERKRKRYRAVRFNIQTFGSIIIVFILKFY